MTRFDRDTALVEVDPGNRDVGHRDGGLGPKAYAARMDTGWWIVRGPNGGYVAAIVLRALIAAVGDPVRSPRSLTVHYLAPPREGDVLITTVIERSGRQLTYASARVTQGDRLLATALGAFAGPLPGASLSFMDARMPVVPPPEACAPLVQTEIEIPMRARYEQRVVPGFGGAGSSEAGSSEIGSAEVGGWIRFAEPRVLDHGALAAISDAWIPAVFSRMTARNSVPTIDLTVHFRAQVPHPTMTPDDFCLAVFRTQAVVDGFLEEDGEIWSPDGVLLAHSRQLGMLLPES